MLPTNRSAQSFISKIKRLPDVLEKGEQFIIQIANERVNVPKNAVVNIEHERRGDLEEMIADCLETSQIIEGEFG